jgi:hypothetical protein
MRIQTMIAYGNSEYEVNQSGYLREGGIHTQNQPAARERYIGLRFAPAQLKVASNTVLTLRRRELK